MKFSLFIGVLVLAQAAGAYGQGTYTQNGANFLGVEQSLTESASGPIVQSYFNDGDAAKSPLTLCCSSCDCGSSCPGNVKSGCCGHRFSWGNDTYVTVGAGIRASYNAIEGANQSGNGGTQQDFSVNNARLYFNGQGHKRIGFEFNTDINGAQGFDYHGGNFGSQNTGEMRILDAVLKFQLTDHINLWTGRFLPPTDRSNLSGPFYANVWNFPFAQFGYPNIFQGRDDGAALWGEYGGGVFKWQTGVFEGESLGGPNVNGHPGKDNLMFSGRVVLNLLDPEPGYYNSSTYYGAKDILAIGASVMHRSDAQENIAQTNTVDFTGWSIDGLFETKLSNRGVVSVEGAYHDFNDNNGETGGVGITLPPSGNNRQGESYFVLGGYLFPRKWCLIGVPGQFQVVGRYQKYDRDIIDGAGGGTDEQVDAQVNYIMFGHNARISAVWSQLDTPASSNVDTFTVGTQVQF